MTPRRADVQTGDYEPMTVELSYVGVQNGLSKTEATTLLGELIDLHGSSNSSSGTYAVEQSNYVADAERFVIEVSLSDCDDDDFPIVKDDLASAIADLPVDFGTKDEIKADLSGSVA